MLSRVTGTGFKVIALSETKHSDNAASPEIGAERVPVHEARRPRAINLTRGYGALDVIMIGRILAAPISEGSANTITVFLACTCHRTRNAETVSSAVAYSVKAAFGVKIVLHQAEGF